MLSDQLTNKIFTYPKFSGLVNSVVEGVDTQIDKDTLLWLETVLMDYFDDKVKKISDYRLRPWSRVFKVETDHGGLFFLKIPAKEFFREAQIVEVIGTFCSDITAKIIARNEANGSFLMAALNGETLRVKLRREFDQSILEDIAARIGEFQKYSRLYMSDFENISIPKWTSLKIIHDCDLLLQNSRFLVHTGLSTTEIVEFRTLFSSINEKLNLLTKFDNGFAIDHGDFQDNNIFVSEGPLLFMDWADSCISIPSFTVGTYCHSILLAHSGITDKSSLVRNILTKYYNKLLGSEYYELHERHISLVHSLYPVICILKTARLLNIEDSKLDMYAVPIIDYWIRVVKSFSVAYRD